MRLALRTPVCPCCARCARAVCRRRVRARYDIDTEIQDYLYTKHPHHDFGKVEEDGTENPYTMNGLEPGDMITKILCTAHYYLKKPFPSLYFEFNKKKSKLLHWHPSHDHRGHAWCQLVRLELPRLLKIVYICNF